MPDDDWSSTNEAPPTAICADITGSNKLGCSYLCRDAAGEVVASDGSCNLQPVLVDATNALKGAAPITLVRAGAADTGVVSGQALTYDDVGNSSRFTLRVAAEALGAGVDRIEIYWNTIA